MIIYTGEAAVFAFPVLFFIVSLPLDEIDPHRFILTALKHITLSPVDRIYSFMLSPDDEKMLGEVCEEYLLARTGKTYKALEFYKSM